MSELRDFFETRKEEVKQFFVFLDKINNDTNYSSDMTILKSQAILMIYNLIEGSVNKGIEYIFDKIADNELRHNEISNDIRVMWFRYFNLHTDDNGQNKQSLEQIDKFINEIVNIEISQFRKINKSYFSSGTLDSQAIKDILKKFSINFNISEYKLREIKTNRNFLAHGEKSFTEVSQEKTLSDLVELKDKTIEYLEQYINAIEEYVDNQRYKI